MSPAPRAARRFQKPHAWWCLCTALVVLAWMPVSPSFATANAESPAIDLSRFDGHWQRIDEGESDAARLSAIDRAITGLSWIMRKMASGVLRNTTAPPAEMEFIWDGDHLYQGLQGQDGASARPVLFDGELRTGEDRRGVPFSWRWSLSEGGLRVHWEQNQANGSNLYRIADDDGRTLVVEHTIIVTAISNVEPIVYRSRFSRTDSPRQSVRLSDVATQATRD